MNAIPRKQGAPKPRTNERWVNLALAGLLIYYVVLIADDLIWGNFCGSIAVDYCSFWSAGYVAKHAGYANVYDLNLMAQVQKPLFPATADESLFTTVPTPFLPVFILPFQLIALMKPFPGYIIWSLINVGGFIGYIYWFYRKLSDRAIPGRLLLMFLLSLPMFLNLFWGQINLFLMICVGEYVRGLMEGKKFRAGLWLGGLLLKPQLLVLILPTLLFQRSFKVLSGFTAIAGITILVSLSLAGLNGIQSLVELWLGYTKGLPSNEPQTMMNWRVIALALNNFAPSVVGWSVTILGIVVTTVIAFSFWRPAVPPASPNFPVAMIGLIAATGSVAWHSHFATSMIIVPVLIFAYIQGVFPRRLFLLWMFFPPFVRFADIMLIVLIQQSLLPVSLIFPLNFAFGLTGLMLNILFLIWSRFKISLSMVENYVESSSTINRI